MQILFSEVFIVGEDAHELRLGVREISLCFDTVRADVTLIIDASCQSLTIDLSLILLMSPEENLNLRKRIIWVRTSFDQVFFL